MAQSEIARALGLTSGNLLDADAVIIGNRTLRQECERLARIAMGLLAKNIEDAYKKQRLTAYHRTYGALKSALDYSMTHEMSDNTITITCTLPNSMMHPSLFGPHAGEMVNTLILMDRGYSWKKPHKFIPYFTDRPAGNIISKTLEDFKKVNTPLVGLELTIQFN